jgi:hypothetical protein
MQDTLPHSSQESRAQKSGYRIKAHWSAWLANPDFDVRLFGRMAGALARSNDPPPGTLEAASRYKTVFPNRWNGLVGSILGAEKQGYSTPLIAHIHHLINADKMDVLTKHSQLLEFAYSYANAPNAYADLSFKDLASIFLANQPPPPQHYYVEDLSQREAKRQTADAQRRIRDVRRVFLDIIKNHKLGKISNIPTDFSYPSLAEALRENLLITSGVKKNPTEEEKLRRQAAEREAQLYSLTENRRIFKGICIDSQATTKPEDAFWVTKKEDGWLLEVAVPDLSLRYKAGSVIDTLYLKNVNELTMDNTPKLARAFKKDTKVPCIIIKTWVSNQGDFQYIGFERALHQGSTYRGRYHKVIGELSNEERAMTEELHSLLKQVSKRFPSNKIYNDLVGGANFLTGCSVGAHMSQDRPGIFLRNTRIGDTNVLGLSTEVSYHLLSGYYLGVSPYVQITSPLRRYQDAHNLRALIGIEHLDNDYVVSVRNEAAIENLRQSVRDQWYNWENRDKRENYQLLRILEKALICGESLPNLPISLLENKNLGVFVTHLERMLSDFSRLFPSRVKEPIVEQIKKLREDVFDLMSEHEETLVVLSLSQRPITPHWPYSNSFFDKTWHAEKEQTSFSAGEIEVLSKRCFSEIDKESLWVKLLQCKKLPEGGKDFLLHVIEGAKPDIGFITTTLAIAKQKQLCGDGIEFLREERKRLAVDSRLQHLRIHTRRCESSIDFLYNFALAPQSYTSLSFSDVLRALDSGTLSPLQPLYEEDGPQEQLVDRIHLAHRELSPIKRKLEKLIHELGYKRRDDIPKDMPTPPEAIAIFQAFLPESRRTYHRTLSSHEEDLPTETNVSSEYSRGGAKI